MYYLTSLLFRTESGKILIPKIYERWRSPSEVVGEIEELVIDGLAEGGFDLHFLETWGISIHANGECQRLFVHELM